MGHIGLLLLIACQENTAEPFPSLGSQANPVVTGSPARTETGDATLEVEYRELANLTFNGMAQLTQIIGRVGVSLAATPEDAPETQETVAAVEGSFELARERLERVNPPPGYDQLHQMLLDALSFYKQAAAALLPDSQTGKADYSRFQELMMQGGKNVHEAGAEISMLARPEN